MFSIKSNVLPKIRFIGEIAYKDPWIHFKRTSDEYIIYIIKQGKMFIQEDANKYVLNKNDFFIFEPKKSHVGYDLSVCEYFYIHFQYPSMHRLESISRSDLVEDLQLRRYKASVSNCLSEAFPNDSISYLPKHYKLMSYDHINILLSEYIDHYGTHHENYKELVSAELLVLLLNISREYTNTLLQDSSSKNKTLTIAQEILNYLNTEYSQKITSTIISERFEKNYDHLNRCFKRMTNYSILNYLNLIRISNAKRLIATSHLNFSEIGYLVGIENPYYFSRLFKKITGISPSEYYRNLMGS